jgi:peptidyl-prolyl cis-trans isomerase SurA
VSALALLALALSLAAPAEPAARRPLDRVAATVNGEVVTLSELQDRAGAEYRRALDQPPGPARDRAVARALQNAFDILVAERLLEAEVKAQQLEVTDAQVDAAIEDIKQRNRFDDAMLRQALAEQGLDLPTFRTRLRRDLETFQVLNAKVRNRVKVTDEDVRNYYQTHPKELGGEEQVRVRHLFFAVPAGASAEQEARVRGEGEKALARLALGEDFADLARQVSQGPSAAEGGDLGWVRHGSIQADLERVAFSLEKGKHSSLLRTKSGFHVLYVEDRRTAAAPPLDQVKDKIRDKLTAEQVDTYRRQYLEQLRREAVIELLVPELQPQAG